MLWECYENNMGVSSEYERSAMENAMGVARDSRGNAGNATEILWEYSRDTAEILWEDNWYTTCEYYEEKNSGHPMGANNAWKLCGNSMIISWECYRNALGML